MFAFRYTGSREPFPDGFPENYFELGPMLFKKNDPLLPRFLENRYNELTASLARAQSSGRKQDIDADIELLGTRLVQTEQAMAYLSRRP